MGATSPAPLHEYRTTKSGIKYRLGPTPSRFDELAGPDNPLKRPPRGKFERMQEQLDLPYKIYVFMRVPEKRVPPDKRDNRAVKTGNTVEFEHAVDLPLRVICPDGKGLLDYSVGGKAGVILDKSPKIGHSYPVEQVNPLPERLYELEIFDSWLSQHGGEAQDEER